MPLGYDKKYATNRLYGEINKETPEAANDYISRTIASITNAQMPEFQRNLQDVRESALQRGLFAGGLPTSYEGDVFSAFQKNIANTAGQYAYQNYDASRNRYLDLLSGTRDYETAMENAKKKKRGGLFGALGSVLGGVGGFLVGGPAGAYAGSQIGGAAGRGVGG